MAYINVKLYLLVSGLGLTQFGTSTGDGDGEDSKVKLFIPTVSYRINELPHPKVPASISQVPSSE